MTCKTVIVNGLVVTEHGVEELDLHIAGGKIAAMTTPGLVKDADQVIDARGLHVYPGGIDPHVHFNEPGLTDGEDFWTGSQSAAAGGITTVLDHPLTVPLTADGRSFREKRALIEEKSVVDFALWSALTPDNLDDLPELVELGSVAFKAFIPVTPDIPAMPDGALVAAMERLADLGGIIGIHCENPQIIDFHRDRLAKAGRKDGLAHPESAPPLAELEAVRRVILFAGSTGARLHVVHVSVPDSILAVESGKAQGINVTAETCPQYLTLDHSALEKWGAYAKCSPPVRDKAMVEGMWHLFLGGQIDCLASDHAPYTFAEKEAYKDDILQVPAGVTGVQTMIPMVLDRALEREPQCHVKLARLIATNAAKRFGLYPQKGAIRVGADADLALLSCDEEWTVKPEGLFYKNKWTPHEGCKVSVKVKRTILRGETTFIDDEDGPRITAEPGYGVFLRPQ